MIRLAAFTNTKNNLIRRGLLHLSKSSVTYRSSSILATRSFSSAKDEEPAPKGIPYSKLTVGVPKERFPMEKRVAATPESVSKLVKPGFNVLIEKGAGTLSHFSDADYENAGAKIVEAEEVWGKSDIVMKCSCIVSTTLQLRERLSTLVTSTDHGRSY